MCVCVCVRSAPVSPLFQHRAPVASEEANWQTEHILRVRYEYVRDSTRGSLVMFYNAEGGELPVCNL